MKQNFSYSYTKNIYENMKYSFFDKGNYNLNIFGIRKNETKPNSFDDLICLAYKVDDKEYMKIYQATTDPGTYWLKNPSNVNGTAILVPGQYKKAFKIGYHQGKYEALKQNTKFKVYRDNDRNNVLNFSAPIYEGSSFGINIHRATANDGQKSVQVDKWSAGCQVIAAKDDFDEFMNIIRKSAKLYGDVFTYTLFTEQQFFG